MHRSDDRIHPPLQTELLREVMFSAAECNAWLTSEQLAHDRISAGEHFGAACGICTRKNTAAIGWRNVAASR
jgi:hypothetical protein